VSPAAVSLVAARAFHSMVAVGSRAYVFGGGFFSLCFKPIEAFNIPIVVEQSSVWLEIF
jgi:hypothetical protein